MNGKYGKMLKQARKIEQEMAKIEEELAQEKVEASAGGAAVKATVNGKQELLEVKINPDVVDAEDVEMLEDLVTAAVKEALRQAKDLASQKMARLTGGLNLPGIV